ncbi:DUF3152 domain-containing protein [Streptomyces sp. NPDC047079]|uniref:DUF3152 domain-containing protein n=1 Tax=Streptomyces sp. NPDC047079 TaxID=3154607 RepID=UPI0033E5E8F6
MGRHSRKGRGTRGNTDTGAVPGIPAPAPPVSGRTPTAGATPTTGTRPPAPRSAADATESRDAVARGRVSARPDSPSGARPEDGPPAQGAYRAPGPPVRGTRRAAEGTVAAGAPRFAEGTPAHGVPRFPADGTPTHGTRPVRGDHPQQREPGGGWGEFGEGVGSTGLTRPAPAGRAEPRVPHQRTRSGPRQEYLDAFAENARRRVTESPADGPATAEDGAEPRVPHQRTRSGPRQEYLDAFAENARRRVTESPADGRSTAEDGAAPRVPHQRTRSGPRQEYLDAFAENARRRVTESPADGPATAEDGAEPRRASGRGRTSAGIAAAAVTTALAIVVAGQVADGQDGGAARSRSATSQARDTHGPAVGGYGTPAPPARPSATPLTYEQAMGRRYPLGATLKASGRFSAVPGFAKAPGTGRKYTYRVDVEKGLGLDAGLFAEAVQKTLNDDRSWAHRGARSFERVSSGKPDFVITLASPGTTATWCAKSGLDTTEDNVSCDSASTERVMINAYRWAQGSTTYGDRIHAYRQMLINHEVGHRLGYGHVTCGKDGELAPVMQQQTKFLDHDGIHCLPNPWPFPGS